MKVLVTGATGKLGSGIVKHIKEAGDAVDLYVSVRDIEKAKAQYGESVIIRHGDFDDRASLDAAFDGIDRLVLVSTDGDTATRIRQHRTAIEAAKAAGVKTIIYTSLVNADASPLNLAEVHKDTEAFLKESGIDSIILRNNWYLENEIDTINTAIESGIITTTLGDAKVGWMLRDEYALAAAKAALGNVSGNQTYTLSNTLYTIDDLAHAISEVSQTEVSVKHISDEDLKSFLEAQGLPSGVASFVTDMNRGIREGGLDAASSDFLSLVGREPTSLVDAVRKVIA